MTPAIESFEERAAIHEYEAGINRINAESMGLRQVVAEFGQEAGREVYQHMQARRTGE